MPRVFYEDTDNVVLVESSSMVGGDQEIESLAFEDFEKYICLPHGSSAFVVKVYDGDTVTLGFRCPHAVATEKPPVRVSARICGIDTPELRSTNEAERALAREARRRLESIVDRKWVKVLRSKHDKYGRILCDLSVDDACPSVRDAMLEAPRLCRAYNGGKKTPWLV